MEGASGTQESLVAPVGAPMALVGTATGATLGNGGGAAALAAPERSGDAAAVQCHGGASVIRVQDATAVALQAGCVVVAPLVAGEGHREAVSESLFVLSVFSSQVTYFLISVTLLTILTFFVTLRIAGPRPSSAPWVGSRPLCRWYAI